MKYDLTGVGARDLLGVQTDCGTFQTTALGAIVSSRWRLGESIWLWRIAWLHSYIVNRPRMQRDLLSGTRSFIPR
jgi:hypothetical protein